jgi:hypothetical protein
LAPSWHILLDIHIIRQFTAKFGLWYGDTSYLQTGHFFLNSGKMTKKFMVVTTVLFAHTTFLWATCCLICFIPIIKPFLTHWSWLRVVPFIERGNRAHGGCDRSTGDAYFSMAPDPTSDIFRGPCTPILWFVFPIGLMKLITDRYFCHFIWLYDHNLLLQNMFYYYYLKGHSHRFR